ncbi:hypothetical protein A1O1_08388 [Capronia coronata CBS 617.96]|uniref:Cytochrome b mRNA-processing protein 4 n=1 Tax=Capronia coronata CBS 617.96 TaxID=1182541 RepID=W9XTC5_9EURO|nr:uncharacterized protein A1O1_08388 [Capronia coronata CBS 617.96]EXJ80246.1 hypothetical protein A1O1_08388 [Capronia coronata CBS 617.96]
MSHLVPNPSVRPVTPAEGELFKKFNPELQKRNLELRDKRQQDYQEFLDQLKEYSKSDKPIWVAAAEAQAKAREELTKKKEEEQSIRQKIKEELRAEVQKG